MLISLNKKTLFIFTIMIVLSNASLVFARIQEISLSGEKESETCKDNICTTKFKSQKLRYSWRYIFNNSMGNFPDSIDIKIKGVHVDFSGTNYFAPELTNGTVWTYSDWIENRKGIIAPGEKGKLIETQKEYTVVYVPQKRGIDNVVITYKTKYKDIIDNKEVGDEKTRIDIQPYEITWCGDGVVDELYEEQCDFNDPKRKNWGAMGCSKTCQSL